MTERMPRDAANIALRDLVDAADLERVVAVEREVWGLEDLDVLPLTMLVATTAAGGVSIGAFDGDALVGFVYGFVGVEHGRTIHHSHMLAVLPAYRNLDLGFRLKLAQRERVLAQGIDRVTWTFDPLQARNANFNISRLGAVSDSYRINFYGEETSSFLHKLGTDRLWVTWALHDERVRRRVAGETARGRDAAPGIAIVRVGEREEPGTGPFRFEADELRIEIPADILALQARDHELAFRWRTATRAAFVAALDAGFVVEEFDRIERGASTVGSYRLVRRPELEEWNER